MTEGLLIQLRQNNPSVNYVDSSPYTGEPTLYMIQCTNAKQSNLDQPALGVFGKSWLKAVSSKKPHLCIPNQRIHKCGFCAKSTLINSENSHSGIRGLVGAQDSTRPCPFGTSESTFNINITIRLSTMYIYLVVSNNTNYINNKKAVHPHRLNVIFMRL